MNIVRREGKRSVVGGRKIEKVNMKWENVLTLREREGKKGGRRNGKCCEMADK